MSPARLRKAALFFALCSVTGAVFAAWRCDFTYDELFHLSWSERLLATGETERSSQERYNTKTSIAAANVLGRRAALAAGATDPRVLRFAARLPTVLWLALLLFATHRIALRLAGEWAAALATIGVALDPNLIAHGALVTVDVAYALFTLFTLQAAIAWRAKPTLARAALVGLALGLAFITKFTAVLLVLGVALVWLVGARETRPSLKKVALLAVVAASLAIAIVDLGYRSQRVFEPLDQAGLNSPLLSELVRLAPSLRLPVPASFLKGLDASFASERGWGPIVVLGRKFDDGVFYYFPVLWLLKTPLLLLALQIAGLVLLVRTGALLQRPAFRFWSANLLLTLAYFTLLFKTQIGYRFVLMCIPIAWILAAAGLAQSRLALRPRLVALALGVAVFENAMYLGNPLSFTNAAVWPKRQAFRLIADSNLDWGQNRDKIQGWLDSHAIKPARLNPQHLLPGPNVLSVNDAAGVFDFAQHRWLREHLDPTEHWGHTYLRFEVDNDTFDRFMNDERLFRPDAASAALCADDLRYKLYTPGSQVRLTRIDAPEPGRVIVACLKTQARVDLGFRVTDGRIRFGRFKTGLVCDADIVQEDQVLWQRFVPGTHAVCAIEMPNRRPSLPYYLAAMFVVRGQSASLDIHELPTDARGAALP